MRIAVGGIHIECSTFNSFQTTLDQFRVLRGHDLAEHPDFGFLHDYDCEFVPTLHARAIPGGPVSLDTYQNLKKDFLARLARSLPVDGLYLAMHGAMYVAGMDDAEGDWISAARDVVGSDCLISVSYDLHGSMSQRIINAIDMFSAYRTAPHIDVEETQRRSYHMLVHCLAANIRPSVVWSSIPVIVSGERSSTEYEPARGLYKRLPQIEAADGVMDASLLVGYAWADEPRTTASSILTGTDLAVLKRAASDLAQHYWEARTHFSFNTTTGSIDECVSRALGAQSRPVILADSGDNPTAGGVGDRVDVLRALLARDAEDVLIAGIADPAATDLCYDHELAAEFDLNIGAALDSSSGEPISTRARLLHLYNADELSEHQAVIRVGGITIVLTRKRRPFHLLEAFEKLGLHLHDFRVLVVKSGYLSPELQPIANPELMALSPGAVDQDIERVPRRRWRQPIFPKEKDFEWAPKVIVTARSLES
jgi:microcystin degradation protein MlrC